MPLPTVPLDPLSAARLGGYGDGYGQTEVMPPSYGRQEMQPTVSIRPRTTAAQTADHPYRIAVSDDLKLTVGYGMATFLHVADDGGNPYALEILPKFDSALGKVLRDDPFNPNGTVGEIQLAAGNTYGVWIVFEWSTNAVGNTLGTVDEYEMILSVYPTRLFSRVEALTSATSPGGDNPWLGESPALTGFYLGQVSVDGNGVPTVVQARRSDIAVQSAFLPKAIQHPE